MLAERLRRLEALAELNSGERITQRSLAARLGISLGLANGLLRGLEAEGLIAVNRSAASQMLRYAVTNEGRTEMLRLALGFASESDRTLAPLRAEIQRRAARLASAGHRRALLYGDGPLADMAASALLNAGMKLVGVVSAETTIGGVAGARIRPPSDLKRLTADVAVALTNTDARRLRSHLGTRVPVVQLLADLADKEMSRGG